MSEEQFSPAEQEIPAEVPRQPLQEEQAGPQRDRQWTIEELLAENARLRAEAAKRRVQKREAVSELDALRAQVNELRQQFQVAQRDAWVNRVAVETNLPILLAKRLQGESYEEILADARELLSVLKSSEPAAAPPARPAVSPANPAQSRGLTKEDLAHMTPEQVQKLSEDELKQILNG